MLMMKARRRRRLRMGDKETWRRERFRMRDEEAVGLEGGGVNGGAGGCAAHSLVFLGRKKWSVVVCGLRSVGCLDAGGFWCWEGEEKFMYLCVSGYC